MSPKKKIKKWITTKESYIIMSCESAILYFAAVADGINTDKSHKNAPKNWQSINSITAKDNHMNSFLVWETLMTCEDGEVQKSI